MGVTATPTAGPTFSLTSVKQPIVFALRVSSGAGGCQPRRRSQVHRIITYSREFLISLPNNFEGTLPAYQYAVRNHADILDADVHWTKDGPDRDTVGTVVILHMRLVDFLKYGNSVGKSFAVEIKVSRITDAQAAPLMERDQELTGPTAGYEYSTSSAEQDQKTGCCRFQTQDQLRADHSWD